MAKYATGLKGADVPEDQPVRVDVGGASIIIIKHGGKLYGLNSACTHAGGPLEEGTIEGEDLVCPIHDGKYRIKTGEAEPETNWVTDLQSYAVAEDMVTGEITVEA